MFLRPYRTNDKRTLQQLFFETVHAVNGADYAPEQLNIWAPSEPDREAWSRLDTQFCFVVECQKQLVGFASMTEDAYVDFLYVHKDFQGRGIASNLLKQLERLARKKGILEMTTEASISARGFFESIGFNLVYEHRKTLSGIDFLNFRMEKKLLPVLKNNTQN